MSDTSTLERKVAKVCDEYAIPTPDPETISQWPRRLKRASYEFLRGFLFVWGFSLGLPFPDKDISWLGIGSHRNFLFHGPLLAVVVWQLHKRGKLGKITAALIAGFLMGMATHLFIDTFIDTGGTIRFFIFGSLIPGTRWDDWLWTGCSSLACLATSIRITIEKAVVQPVVTVVKQVVRAVVNFGRRLWRRLFG